MIAGRQPNVALSLRERFGLAKREDYVRRLAALAAARNVGGTTADLWQREKARLRGEPMKTFWMLIAATVVSMGVADISHAALIILGNLPPTNDGSIAVVDSGLDGVGAHRF